MGNVESGSSCLGAVSSSSAADDGAGDVADFVPSSSVNTDEVFDRLIDSLKHDDEGTMLQCLHTLWVNVDGIVLSFEDELDREERVGGMARCLQSSSVPVRRDCARLLSTIIRSILRDDAGLGSHGDSGGGGTPSAREVHNAARIANHFRTRGVLDVLILAMASTDEPLQLTALQAIEALTFDFKNRLPTEVEMGVEYIRHRATVEEITSLIHTRMVESNGLQVMLAGVLHKSRLMSSLATRVLRNILTPPVKASAMRRTVWMSAAKSIVYHDGMRIACALLLNRKQRQQLSLRNERVRIRISIIYD